MGFVFACLFIGLFIAKTLTRAYWGPGSTGPSGSRWMNLTLAVFFIGFLAVLGIQMIFVLINYQ